MSYKCSKCGKKHERWPSIAYSAPYHYHNLSDENKKAIAQINDDFCIIRHGEQTDRFIRAVLLQKVIDYCDTLDYGVWVSLSEKSFDDYYEHFDSDEHEAVYFGYLCNQISEYESTLAIKVDVIVSKGGNRPEIVPNKDQMDNQFVEDYFQGIKKEEAQARIEYAFEV